MSLCNRLIIATLVFLLPAYALAAQLTLTWTDNSADEQGFKVERCLVVSPATSCANYVQIATVPSLLDTGGLKTWVNSGLTVGQTWCYRVRGYSVGGNSAYSNEACGQVIAQGPPNSPDFLAVQ